MSIINVFVAVFMTVVTVVAVVAVVICFCEKTARRNKQPSTPKRKKKAVCPGAPGPKRTVHRTNSRRLIFYDSE